MEALLSIEVVLETGRKSSTYKFALLTAIIDYILENPTENPQNGFHTIPIIYLAQQVTYYYYALTWFGDHGVKQSNSGKLEIYNQIKDKMSKISSGNKVFSEVEGVYNLRDLVDNNEILDEQIIRLIVNIRKILLDMPINYIKIGGDNFGDHKFLEFDTQSKNYTLFGLYNSILDSSINRKFSEVLNHPNTKNWDNFSSRQSKTWSEFLNEEVVFLQMGHYAYLQLVKSRIYIRDFIIKRWIEYSVSTYLENDGKAVYQLVKSFSLMEQFPSREPTKIRKLKKIINENFDKITCIYCLKHKQEFALDHFIPWSKYPVNTFWNLYPSCQTCNSSKSNKILVINRELENRLTDANKKLLIYFNKHPDQLLMFDNGLLSNTPINLRIDRIIDHLKQVIQNLV